MSKRLECEEVREALASLIDDELSEARRHAVSAHMLVCDDCSRAAGRMVAAKRIVQRDHPQVEAPAGFMSRLQEHLDAVEDVRKRVQQPGRPRRMTVVAAAGAIAVSLAIIFSTVYFINNDQALELAQMHQQVTGLSGPMPGGSSFSAVSCDPARDNWREAHQTLVNIDGVLVTYTLYRVGTCPVSVFTGPATWEPYRTGWRITQDIDGMKVRQLGEHAVTSWSRGGRRHVLIASAPPEAVAALARAQMASLGRSLGL